MIQTKLIGSLLVCSALMAALGPAAAADAPSQAVSAAASTNPPMPAPPPAECTAVLDRLSKEIPVAETGPALRRQGLRIRTPIVVAEGAITETDVVSAARVRVRLDSNGNVIPGSVTVQQAIGDPKLPLALSQAVPASLSFDVSGAFTAPKEFAFTTVYVVCARK